MAVVTLSSFVLGLHKVRKCKPMHMRLLIDNLMNKDKTGFEKYLDNIKYLQPKTFQKFKL